jgi:hypothetical protein
MSPKASIVLLAALLGCSKRPAATSALTLHELQWRALPDSGNELNDLQKTMGNSGSVSKVEAYALDSLRSTRLLFMKYTTGSGTSWHQAEYRISLGGRVLWRALAEESTAKDSFTGAREYHIQTCLLVGKDSLISYVVAATTPAAHEALAADTTLPEGAYALRAGADSFQYLGLGGTDARAQCRLSAQ